MPEITQRVSISALPDAATLPAWLQADLRSDHAGETGAVWIYRGILHVSRDEMVRAFAEDHLATEEEHLAFFEDWLPGTVKSRLIVAWRISGWLLGSLSALGGRKGVFAAIEAVETFVVKHYDDQLQALDKDPQDPAIAVALRRFMQDEDDHRSDALHRQAGIAPGPLARAWQWIVGWGSSSAVVVARLI